MSKSKKELDKDLMFSKILPALTSNPFSLTNAPGVSDVSGAPGGPASSAVRAESDYIPESLSALREKIFAKSVEFSDPENIFATNIMEHLVLKNVDSVIQRFNVCSCDHCRCDICAYALNILPPRYIVAKPESIARAENEIPKKMVVDALIKAVIRVRAHPHH